MRNNINKMKMRLNILRMNAKTLNNTKLFNKKINSLTLEDSQRFANALKVTKFYQINKENIFLIDGKMLISLITVTLILFLIWYFKDEITEKLIELIILIISLIIIYYLKKRNKKEDK